MAITAFTGPISGLWPWGLITVATAGTTVPLNINIGAQTATPATHPTGMVRQVEVAAGNTNTGYMYILRKVQGVTVTAAGTPNFIVAVIPPGMARPVPFSPINATINADDYVVDSDTGGGSIYVIAYYA